MKSYKEEVWMAWVWPGYHWYQGLNPFLAYINDIPRLGYKFSKLAATYSKGTEAYYFIQREYEANGERFLVAVKENPDKLFAVLTEVNNAAEEIFKLGKKWDRIDFNKLNNSELIAKHRELFEWDGPLWRNGQIPNLLELHNHYLSDYVKDIIRQRFKGDQSELFKTLTTSNYDSMTERQDHDFLVLLKRKNSKAVKRHWKKYLWMTYGWAGPALTYEYFLQNYEEALKNKQIAKNIEKNIKDKKATLADQKKLLGQLPEKDKKLVVLLREILEAKARRVDAHSLTYFLAEKMMIEIGKRVGLSLNQMRVVAPTGVKDLFKKVDQNRINSEYNRVLYWFGRNQLRKFIGTKAEQKLKYITDRVPKAKLTREFKGELAYPGKVRGRVKIILDVKDAAKLQKGDILVTRMTDPNYVPIMKLAGAILTDIGGITCHAAIVSRELRKPCLVGTKFATQVLKDGDLIEVDANKGIVRKV